MKIVSIPLTAVGDEHLLRLVRALMLLASTPNKLLDYLKSRGYVQ